MMFAEMIRTENAIRLRNELVIESVRATRFPKQVSRLTGIFFFGDRADALRASSWGGYFNSKYLSAVEVESAETVTQVDSKWITSAPLREDGSLDPLRLSWIDSYWRGAPYDSQPMWESIFIGRMWVCETELRKLAYDYLKGMFPNALDTLELSRLGAAVLSNIGRVVAWLTCDGIDSLQLAYYIDMQEANDPEVLQRIAVHEGPRNFADLAIGKETLGLPDLREYSKRFNISSTYTLPGTAN